ncbi:MAG: hypothetical protein ACKO1K_03305 [Burkholderiales bacterium]
MTVIDFGNARVGTGIATNGAVGVAATKVARGGVFPAGALGRSSEAGTDVATFADLAGVIGGCADDAAAFVLDLGAAFGGADFVAVFFGVTFGGTFESLDVDGLAAFPAAFGTTLAFVPFDEAFGPTAVALVPLPSGFDPGAALGCALSDLAFTAVLDWAAVDFVDGFAFVTALPFKAGFVGVFFLATWVVFVAFVDFPPTLLLVAVLAFFAVANLISSAVFLQSSLPPAAGGGISKTRKSTESIGQRQRIIRYLQLLEYKHFSTEANLFAAIGLKLPEGRAKSHNRT